jgi:diguanylate cyclase (GGDEF)-like protein
LKRQLKGSFHIRESIMETLQQILNHLKQDQIVATDFDQLSNHILGMLQNEFGAHFSSIGRDTLKDVITLFQSIPLISGSQNLKQIAQSTAEQMLAVMKTEACTIFAWSQVSGTIRMKAFSSANFELQPSWDRPVNIKDFPDLRQILEEKKAIQATVDPTNVISLAWNDLRQVGIRTVMFLPLMVRQRLIGLVEVFDRKPVQDLDERRLMLGQILANQAALRIDQARLLQAFKRRAAELESVFRAGLNLTASRELKAVLAAILESVFDLIKGSRHAHIFLFQKDGLEFGAALWDTPNGRRSGDKLRPNALQYRTAKKGRTFVIPESKFSGLTVVGFPEPQGAIACLPLKIGPRVVGVMTVSHNRSSAFSQANLHTLQLLGDQAAIAIENARLHDLLNRQAYTDSLTGLPNRRALDERLENETLRASRYQHPFTLGMLDLNGFKHINDTYGHLAGDDALRQVVGSLRSSLRDTDFLARYGGDEFAIMMPETEIETAKAIMDRLARAVADNCVSLPGAEQQKITISIGLAMYPVHAISAQALLLAADQALYKSKAALG